MSLSSSFLCLPDFFKCLRKSHCCKESPNTMLARRKQTMLLGEFEGMSVSIGSISWEKEGWALSVGLCFSKERWKWQRIGIDRGAEGTHQYWCFKNS